MTQTIARLTPLADVQALVAEKVRPVAAVNINIADAVGCVLAQDIAAQPRPAQAIALADGWALCADDTLGAGGYAPVPLATAPRWVDAGAPLPPNCDCIAPHEALRVTEEQAEALAEIAPGEGVLPAEGDHNGAAALASAGVRLTETQVAALAALGVSHIRVRRPRLALTCVRDDAILRAASALILRDAERRGARVERLEDCDAAMSTDADAVLVIGGTGAGSGDTSASTLARIGDLAVHGIALAPGETAGFGSVAHRPVVLLPGRLDAVLAVWLMLGRVVLDRLCAFNLVSERPDTLTLSRKVTSTVGVTELVPVRRKDAQAFPLASRYWPLSTIALADGYIVILPESEGSSAGSAVQVWPWP